MKITIKPSTDQICAEHTHMGMVYDYYGDIITPIHECALHMDVSGYNIAFLQLKEDSFCTLLLDPQDPVTCIGTLEIVVNRLTPH
jgi:hypothetical protein